MIRMDLAHERKVRRRSVPEYWWYIGLFAVLILFFVWAIGDCASRAKVLGGSMIWSRDMGCLVEMPDGTLRKP